jgi:hypothetical protein
MKFAAGGGGGGATTDTAISTGGLAGSGYAWMNNAQVSSGYTWSNITSITTARGYCFATGNADNAIIGGGWDNAIVSNSQVWTGSWSTETALNAERRDTTAVLGKYDECLAVYGRNAAGSLLNSSASWNGSSWSTGTTANTAREHAAGAGAFDDGLIGGGYESSGDSNKVDSWDGSSFTTETVMTTAAYGQNMAAVSYDSADIAGEGMWGSYDGTTWTTHASSGISATHYFGGGGGAVDDHLICGGYKPYDYYDTTFLWDGSAWASKGNLTTVRYAGAGQCIS